MNTPRSGKRRVALLIVAIVLATSWFVWLRPTALGGPASYVIVQGTSMEPTYHDGDLVLVREASHYEDGDVIAFRAGGVFDDQTRIIHRIVGEAEEGTFKTRGDNRDEIDPWTPGPDDIIGTAAFTSRWPVEQLASSPTRRPSRPSAAPRSSSAARSGDAAVESLNPTSTPRSPSR